MEGDLSEKGPARPITPSSSHGESTETGSAPKLKTEALNTGTESPAEEDLRKLDSHIITVPEKEQKEDPFAHLPPDEAEILRRQVDIPVVKSGYLTLYRYATTNDKIIIAISVFCAIAGGAALPLMTVRLSETRRNLRDIANTFPLGCLRPISRSISRRHPRNTWWRGF
jgi:ATP-binding cassette subfamily B (MDR/TAP) protein 1